MRHFKFMRTLLMAFLIGAAFMASGNAIAPTNHTEIAIYAEQAPHTTNAPPAVLKTGSKGSIAIETKTATVTRLFETATKGQVC